MRFNSARSKGSNRTDTGYLGGRWGTNNYGLPRSPETSTGFSFAIEESHVRASLFSPILILFESFFIFGICPPQAENLTIGI
jgi:hypothetical protein